MVISALLSLALASALAEPQAAPACATKGNRSARPFGFRMDSPIDIAMLLSVTSVLAPAETATASRTIGCLRTTTILGGETYSLTGENSDMHPRRLVGSAPDSPLFYLAPFENIGVLLSGKGPERPIALLVVDERGAAFYRAYSHIPTDDALIGDAKAIAAGRLRPLAAFPNGGKDLQIFVGQ